MHRHCIIVVVFTYLAFSSNPAEKVTIPTVALHLGMFEPIERAQHKY